MLIVHLENTKNVIVFHEFDFNLTQLCRKIKKEKTKETSKEKSKQEQEEARAKKNGKLLEHNATERRGTTPHVYALPFKVQLDRF